MNNWTLHYIVGTDNTFELRNQLNTDISMNGLKSTRLKSSYRDKEVEKICKFKATKSKEQKRQDRLEEKFALKTNVISRYMFFNAGIQQI